MMLAREIAVARKVAEESAKLALKHQAAGVRAEMKADESPVTVADRESEQLIARTLEEAFPEDGILGEEGSQKVSRSGRRWIIDPIDGTRDFVRGNLLWSVLIGLEREGDVVAGVVHMPMLGQTCWASRGCGAFRNDTRLRVSSVRDPRLAVLSVNSLNRIREMEFTSRLIDWTSKFCAFRCLGGTPDAIQTSASPAATMIASGVPPRHRKAQNFEVQSISLEVNSISRMRFRLFTDNTASLGSRTDETRSRVSLRKAPQPREAQHVWPSIGMCTTPATTSPSRSRPIRTLQRRLPRTKSRVPSIGSIIHRRPLLETFCDPSSPRIPSSGNASSRVLAINCSDSRSATVTGDSSAFISARTPAAWCFRANFADSSATFLATAISRASIIHWHGSIEPDERSQSR